MYHGDHQPPHIHAEYQRHEAFVDILSGEIIAGGLPTRAARLVREWRLEHQEELLEDCSLAQRFEPLNTIPGADND